MVTVAGGKGINVARVYKTLGGQPFATGFLAGANGRTVLRALGAEQIESRFVRTRGESRICIAVIDTAAGTQTEINEPGPAVTRRAVEALKRQVEALLETRRFAFLVLSGSLPPDAPKTLYADLISIAKRNSTRAVLDSSGDALVAGAEAIPWLIKPNSAELETLAGGSVTSAPEAVSAAKALVETGIHIVAATRGSHGALLVTRDEVWSGEPAPVAFASAVASGDSFLAALLWKWERAAAQTRAAEALQLAIGAGAANAARVGAGLCSLESILSHASQAVVRQWE